MAEVEPHIHVPGTVMNDRFGLFAKLAKQARLLGVRLARGWW